MNNLLDAVLASNNKSDNPDHYDEYGLPINRSNELDYTAARVFARNPRIYLYPEDNRLYIGKRPVSETANELVRLSNISNQWTKSARAPIVWNRIREMAPQYSDSCIWITDKILWDVDNHAIIYQESKENHI